MYCSRKPGKCYSCYLFVSSASNNLNIAAGVWQEGLSAVNIQYATNVTCSIWQRTLNSPRVWTVGHLVVAMCPSTHTFIGLSSALGAGILHPENGCRKTREPLFPPRKKKHQLVLHSNSVIKMNQSACCVQYDTLNEYVAVTVGKRLSFSRVAPVPGDLCRLFRIPLSQQTALTRVRPARAANGPLTHFHRGRGSWK